MKQIIAVDDESRMLEMYERVLREQGYNVLTTSSPASGLQMIKECPPDLVILDVVMPGMNGIEVFEEFTKTLHKIPVLFATGYPESFNMGSEQVIALWKRCFSEGNVDIIYKPFENDRLISKIVGLIGTAQEA